ncbi:MAG: large conductance mechanosensitive channel protein MscL [Kiritimatiellia bacterium]
MGVLKEFRDFAVKGNVMDMAVGVIIGAAFGKIVGSMVNDIMMPVLGQLTSGIDFKDKFIQLAHRDTPVATLAAAKEKGIAVLSYGAFINEVITFTIVAFAVFMLVKGLNKMKKQEAATPSAPPPPTSSERLLAEIRDELRKR